MNQCLSVQYECGSQNLIHAEETLRRRLSKDAIDACAMLDRTGVEGVLAKKKRIVCVCVCVCVCV